jgi:hypothetical protein
VIGHGRMLLRPRLADLAFGPVDLDDEPAKGGQRLLQLGHVPAQIRGSLEPRSAQHLVQVLRLEPHGDQLAPAQKRRRIARPEGLETEPLQVRSQPLTAGEPAQTDDLLRETAAQAVAFPAQRRLRRLRGVELQVGRGQLVRDPFRVRLRAIRKAAKSGSSSP